MKQREYSIRPVPGFGFAIVVDGRDEVALEDLDEVAAELVKLVRAETTSGHVTGIVPDPSTPYRPEFEITVETLREYAIAIEAAFGHKAGA